LFPLGQVFATLGALAALLIAQQTPHEFIVRHVTGDWGDLVPEDIRENEYGLAHSLRIFSSYHLRTGEKLWLITEADRSVTTFLLPSEY
jgi:hypothetical protein